ncbi:hypothetical protein ON010_g945 [Phytophthora cinnamomi]|nr:hypothetical protein ON010_g945 [Phytophthora cinnamomi]
MVGSTPAARQPRAAGRGQEEAEEAARRRLGQGQGQGETLGAQRGQAPRRRHGPKGEQVAGQGQETQSQPRSLGPQEAQSESQSRPRPRQWARQRPRPRPRPGGMSTCLDDTIDTGAWPRDRGGRYPAKGGELAASTPKAARPRASGTDVRGQHRLAVVSELDHLRAVLVGLTVEQVGAHRVDGQHVVLEQRGQSSLLQLGGGRGRLIRLLRAAPAAPGASTPLGRRVHDGGRDGRQVIGGLRRRQEAHGRLLGHGGGGLRGAAGCHRGTSADHAGLQRNEATVRQVKERKVAISCFSPDCCHVLAVPGAARAARVLPAGRLWCLRRARGAGHLRAGRGGAARDGPLAAQERARAAGQDRGAAARDMRLRHQGAARAAGRRDRGFGGQLAATVLHIFNGGLFNTTDAPLASTQEVLVVEDANDDVELAVGMEFPSIKELKASVARYCVVHGFEHNKPSNRRDFIKVVFSSHAECSFQLRGSKTAVVRITYLDKTHSATHVAHTDLHQRLQSQVSQAFLVEVARDCMECNRDGKSLKLVANWARSADGLTTSTMRLGRCSALQRHPPCQSLLRLATGAAGVGVGAPGPLFSSVVMFLWAQNLFKPDPQTGCTAIAVPGASHLWSYPPVSNTCCSCRCRESSPSWYRRRTGCAARSLRPPGQFLLAHRRVREHLRRALFRAPSIDLIDGMPVQVTQNVRPTKGAANGTLGTLEHVAFSANTTFKIVHDSNAGIDGKIASSHHFMHSSPELWKTVQRRSGGTGRSRQTTPRRPSTRTLVSPLDRTRATLGEEVVLQVVAHWYDNTARCICWS